MLTSISRPVSRRRFLQSLGSACVATRLIAQDVNSVHFNVADYDRDRILAAARTALDAKPLTVTSLPAPVKSLSPNTYYSEDAEWWPEEKEHRLGQTNPAAFCQHRDALVTMNGNVAACVAAWRLTSDEKYARQALALLRTWFLEPATRMEPNLDHAAVLPPSPEGTPRGVEETVMLAETSRAASFICAYNGPATAEDAAGLRAWFADFSTWLNENKKGFIAREAKDRLAICWTLQAAEMARFTRNTALQLECGHRFRDVLLRGMNFDGQFPAELRRPDAYAASIFTLECLALTCETLSTPMDRAWDFNLPDGRGMRSAVAFLFPSLESRARWRLPADAQHFTDWPVRPMSLLLAGRAYSLADYVAAWKRLPADPKAQELLRRIPARQPALWTVRAPAF